MRSLLVAPFLALWMLPAQAEDLPAQAEVLPGHRLQAPGPLAARPFALPAAQTATLSNGLDVLVVENHEVPLVYVNLVVRSGAATDPAGLEGLASSTLDMMDEGAGSRSAEALSVASRKLGADVGTFASLDYAGVELSVLRRNLEPALDLLADVALRPTFPESDWELRRKQRVQGLAASRTDPDRVAARVYSRLMHGNTYAGRHPSEDSYAAISTAEMARWHAAHMRPEDAILLVGGDTTLDQILPLLEARFGEWTVDTPAPARVDLSAPLPEHPANTLYLHHIDGAAQSVLRMGAFVMDRTAPEAAAFALANRAFGGQFMSRLNLNLREDKGWTYGARSSIAHSERPDLWTIQTSVVTPATAGSLTEALRELQGLTEGGESASGEPFGPLNGEELELVRDGLLYSWPLSFENPGHLLRERLQMWRYDLPGDWLSAYPERMQSVAVEAATEAWAAQVRKERLVIAVVGDANVIRPEVEALGFQVVLVDADGAPSAD